MHQIGNSVLIVSDQSIRSARGSIAYTGLEEVLHGQVSLTDIVFEVDGHQIGKSRDRKCHARRTDQGCCHDEEAWMGWIQGIADASCNGCNEHASNAVRDEGCDNKSQD